MNERTVVVRDWPAGLDQLTGALESEAKAGRIERELAETLALVLEEVAANVFDHGFDDPAQAEIEVTIRTASERLELELRDRGRPFDPLALPPPDLDSDIEDRAVGGLGVHLARTLMDEMTYMRDGDVNRVILAKKQGHGKKER